MSARHPLPKLPRPHGLFFLAFCTLGAPALITNGGCTNEAQASPPTQPDEAAESPTDSAASGVAVPSNAPKPSPATGKLRYDPHDSLAPLVMAVEPAVVSIQARRNRGGGLFGGGSSSGIGSGFIISPDGLVVTNHHVVAGNDEFEVHLHDGRRYVGEVVGSDPQTDLAVLRLVDAKRLPAVEFGSSEALQVGDWVVAMGSPMGLERTVTRGIISAKGRGSLGLYDDGYADFLQTDAAINPGNSGGPLFNLAGEVVGINTAIVGHDGLGFAIPADQAKFVVPQLIADGKASRGWLGVAGRDVPPAYGAMPEKGAVLGEIHVGTPAADAGLHAGDRIVAIDGKAIDSFEQLRTRIGERKPHDKVELELVREGQRMKLPVELGERPDPNRISSYTKPNSPSPQPSPQPKASGDLYSGQSARLGVEVRELPEGVVIERIVEGGVGHRLGLRVGDVIEKVNGKAVSSVAEILSALEADRSRAEVEVERGNGRHTAMISAG